MINNKKFTGIIILMIISVFADDMQSKLMSIAAQEAQIANIGSNKYMMLYGLENPLPVINRWNQIQNRPALTGTQIAQINDLEAEKQQFLKQVSN